MSIALTPPQILLATHRVDEFSCGESTLDEWLKRRALANQASGASRTFVVTNQEKRVYGYYALAAGAVSHAISTSNLRRNMPDPIPVVVLGRLAVDHQVQGMQLGGALLQDAVGRAGIIAQNMGVRALLVHALNDRAKAFYEHYGFQASPIDHLVLTLRLSNTKFVF